MVTPGLKRGLWASAALTAAIIAWACGADDAEAPAPAAPTQAQGCRSFAELMPRFVDALSTGKTEGLREVISLHLLTADRKGGIPPVNDVLRSVFQTLSRFADLPAEKGAPEGQTCAAAPPPVAEGHPLCEVRRALDTLVHQGKGLDALRLTDPLITGLSDYIIGRPPVSSTPHYEVATAVHDMCVQNAVCQLTDGLDLVIGLTAFSETSAGTAALNRLGTLVQNPALNAFLVGDGSKYGGEAGIVALGNEVNTIVLGMSDPSELDNLPIDQLPAALRPDVKAGLEDLKLLLAPTRSPNVLKPLKKVINCFAEKDKHSDVVRMLYRLGLVQHLPAFGLTRLVATIKGLRETDSRGALVHLIRTLAEAIREDEQAVASAARVCQTLFDTENGASLTQSNAQLALPVIADLFAQGAAAEAICAADTLIYGCAGGPQPACAPAAP